jgi:hypothetical protein
MKTTEQLLPLTICNISVHCEIDSVAQDPPLSTANPLVLSLIRFRLNTIHTLAADPASSIKTYDSQSKQALKHTSSLV